MKALAKTSSSTHTFELQLTFIFIAVCSAFGGSAAIGARVGTIDGNGVGPHLSIADSLEPVHWTSKVPWRDAKYKLLSTDRNSKE
jgi:hypothetical protein